MRKGQTGLGLVILGVVTIIAVIGLVLLFTRASTTGQAYLNYVGMSYSKPYVAEKGALSLEAAHLIAVGSRIEDIPQCREQWGIPPQQWNYVSKNQITCYQVQAGDSSNLIGNPNPNANYKGSMPSNIYCFLNNIGSSEGLDWYKEENKICYPNKGRRNPNGPYTTV